MSLVLYRALTSMLSSLAVFKVGRLSISRAALSLEKEDSRRIL